MRVKLRVAVTTAVLASMTACGSTPAPTDADAVTNRAQDVYDDIGGDLDQREALHYLQFEALNGGYHACLAEHGERVTSSFVPIWSGHISSPWYGVLLAPMDQPPSRIALAQRVVAEADMKAESSARRDANSPSFQRAAALCDSAHGEDESIPQRAKVSDVLLSEWTKMLDRVDAEIGTAAEYEDCLTQAGIVLKTGDEDGYWALAATLESQMPTPPARGEEGSPEWQDYLAQEAAAMNADRACRGGQYGRAMGLVADELDGFVQEHEKQVAASAAAWAEILTEARAAGFVPARS